MTARKRIARMSGFPLSSSTTTLMVPMFCEFESDLELGLMAAMASLFAARSSVFCMVALDPGWLKSADTRLFGVRL